MRYADVIIRTEPEITVSYRTGMTVFEEGLRDGRWVALSYSASGHLMAANNRPTPTYMNLSGVAKPQSFSVNVDGQDLISHWRYDGADVKRGDGKVSVRVTLTHTVRPARVYIDTLLDGTAILQRSVSVENIGSGDMALAALSPLSGALQQMSWGKNRVDIRSPYRVGYMKGSSWGTEGAFRWEELPDEVFTICGRYRRDRHRHPMFALENRLTGEMFIAQLGWSGGYAFTFDLNRERRDEATLSIDIAMDSPAPIRVIPAGEAYESPKVHIGAVFGGLDPAINEMHDHIRESVFLPPTRGVRGFVESGIGPEYDMDVDSTKAALMHAVSVGSEVFFIDAGWYLPPDRENEWWDYCGDWRFNPERYPNGIGEIRDLAHENGLLFGMWMDADRIGPKSRVWNEHEDWIAKNYTGKSTGSGLLNLADPEVTAWMEKQIRFLLDEYKIDMFRLDHNVENLASVAYNARGGFLENTYARYYENLYAMYARLRRDYPEVIFENCAGGGGRTDLGMLQNFTHSWVTDWQIHPNAFSVTNGMTMALPPECVDRLIGGQFAYATADMRTLIRNLLFARASIGTFKPHYAEANPIQMEIVRHHVDIYKNFVRPMREDSLIFHHTPDLGAAQDGFGILETAARDRHCGMIGVFRLAEPERETLTVFPRGVDPAATYAVTFDNDDATVTMSGREMRGGLPIRLAGALTSELILYKKI